MTEEKKTTVREARTIIEVLLSKLMTGNKYIFWGTLLTLFKIKVIPGYPHLAALSYDPDKTLPSIVIALSTFDKMSPKEIGFLLIHEIKHFIFLHIWRGNGKDFQIWNFATDAFINESINLEMDSRNYLTNLITEDRYFKTPNPKRPDYEEVSADQASIEIYESVGGVLTNTLDRALIWMVKGQSVESHSADLIYREYLKDSKMKKIAQSMSKSGSVSSHEEWKKIREMMSKITAEGTVKKIIMDTSKAVGIGNTPSQIQELIKGFHKPRFKWRHYFRNWIGRAKSSIKTYSYGKTHNVVPDLLPGSKKITKSHIGFIIDVSGSVNDVEFAQFISEMISISTMNTCSYIEVDTHPGPVHKFNGQKIKQNGILRTGQGGTDMQPGLNMMIKENVDIIVLFTDGWIPTLNLTKLKKPFLVVINENGQKLPRNKKYHQLQMKRT